LLKAFGYRSPTIAAHYTGLALIITAGGIAMGVPAGIWLGWLLSGVYQQFFHFPALVFAVPVTLVAVACAAAAAVTTAGSLVAVRSAVRLPPAEAMRPPSPPRFRRTLVERLGLGRRLSPWANMIARNLERRPVRAGLTVAAIALAVGIMLLGRFVDALEFIIETELEIGQRQTATVTFIEQQPPRAVLELARYPGVLAVEPFRSVAVTFRHGTRQRRGSIGGILPSPALVRVLDANRQAIALPPEGLVLSDKLARLLDVRAGDSLSVEIREGRRGTCEVVVAGTLQDYVGTSAFMSAAALARLLREAPVVTGAHLLVDASAEPAFLARVKDTRDIASVTTTRAMRESIRSTLQRNFAISLSFLIVLAGIIAFGVVYNTTRIGLAERAWELATLRVIGFTRVEAGAILLAEAALLLILALPLGLALGYGEASLVAAAYDSEQYRIPVFFRRSSYGISVLVVVVAAVLSGAVVWRLIGRLDLIAVLKTRE
jgi:putative ABC transport system permease protein